MVSASRGAFLVRIFTKVFILDSVLSPRRIVGFIVTYQAYKKLSHGDLLKVKSREVSLFTQSTPRFLGDTHKTPLVLSDLGGRKTSVTSTDSLYRW